ncbi:MAG TPA: ABC transporter permease [Mycobacteriales bacterium]|nr:ABC transporter permease [Mycobacteriales bacterium]
MTATTMTGALVRRALPASRGGRGAHLLVERNAMVARRIWLLMVSGFFEPLFYLFSVGIGVGALVGRVPLPDGRLIGYSAFVAPALLASSAMNGAIYDSTFNIFFKLKYAKLYDAVLSTPLGTIDVAVGEIGWALIRGSVYAVAFLVVMLGMGLVGSWWALLALPAAILIGFAFAAVGMALTSYMKSWQDFEWVQLAILPMFMFATTFYPLGTYPRTLQIVVEATPLYHGIELVRGLTTGSVGVGLLVHVSYLLAMGLAGLAVSARRLERLLLT